MFFKLKPLLYSIVYLAVLEFLTFYRQWFFAVLFFLIFFSIFIIWPLARKIFFLASPFFLSISSICLLFFVSSFLESQIFIFLSVVVYYLSLLGSYRLKIYPCDKTAQGMINLVAIATIFFFFVATFRWFLTYDISAWILVIIIGGGSFLVNASLFNVILSDYQKIKERLERRKEVCGIKIIEDKQILLFLDLVFSLIIAQISWFLLLWPFNPITTGTVLMIIYYGFWDILKNLIHYELSCKRIIFDVFLLCLTVAVILFTAQWNLIV